MFYLYRVIIALLLIIFTAIILLFNIKFREIKNECIIPNAKVTVKKKIYTISFFLLTYILVFWGLCNLPFEAPFVRFDTVEDSLSYKMIDTNNVKIFEYSDCVFAVGNEDEIYSITKLNDEYCMVDYCAFDAQYYQKSINKDLKNFINAKYNKTANKTFYTVVANDRGGNTKQSVHLNGVEMEFAKTYATSFPDPFPNEVSLHTVMLNGEFLEQFDVCLNGSEITFCLS